MTSIVSAGVFSENEGFGKAGRGGGSAPHPACFFVFPVLREVCFLLIEESVLNGVK